MRQEGVGEVVAKPGRWGRIPGVRAQAWSAAAGEGEDAALSAMAPWLARLTGLGLELPPAARPVATYVPAAAFGGLVWVSGQLPMVRGEVAVRGRLGAGLDLAAGQEAARLCVLNALAAACAVVPGGAAGLEGVLRVEGFVQCTPEFHDQPRVVNGASDLLAVLFPGGGHVRTAVGCAALPLDAAVEVAVVFRATSHP